MSTVKHIHSAMDKIRISIQDNDGDIATIRVDGVIDTLTANQLDEAIGAVINRSKCKITLDLAGVDYISSAGWGAMIAHLKNVREHSGDLKISGMIPNVREIYELLEFDTILESHETTLGAITSFKSGTTVLDGGPRAQGGGSEGTLEELMAIGVDSAAEVHDSDASSPVTIGGMEGKILNLIIEDPFQSIRELSAELRRAGDSEASWWTVFTVLRRGELLTKRSRFRLARKRGR